MKANTKIIQFVFATTAVLMTLWLSSCTIRKVSDKDKGPKITKEYDLKDFNSIDIASAGDVVFVQDSVYSIKIEASQKDLDRLDVKVENNSLVVGEKEEKDMRHFSFGNVSREYKITIHAPELNAATLAGSGDFISEKIVSDNLTLTLAGSGSITIKDLEGNAFRATVAGSGDINITEKNVAQSEFSVAGSGNINANLKDCGYVKAGIAGSGDITLTGNAKYADTGVAGSGEVHRDGLKITK